MRSCIFEGHRQAILAQQDETWNAVTVHTQFDIIAVRVPQLQARCNEELNRVWCDCRADPEGADVCR